MYKYWKQFSSFLAVSAALCLIGLSGCAARGTVRVYDPAYGDYHYWNRTEIGEYHRWETQTHRRDEDFRHRSEEEQEEYWRWRHQHEHHDDQD